MDSLYQDAAWPRKLSIKDIANVFGIDFAYLVPQKQDHPLAETLRFSLLFNFQPATEIDESVTDE